jgi:hypothetical protein
MFVILIIVVCGQVIAEPNLGTELMPNNYLQSIAGWTTTKGSAGTSPNVFETRNGTLHVSSERNLKVAQEWPGTGVKSPSFATKTGKTYQISFRVKVLKGSIEVTYVNGAGTWARAIGQFGGYAASDPPNDWETFVAEVSETAGGQNAYLLLDTFGGGSATFDLTDISVKEVDRSPSTILSAWKSVFPKKEFVCWDKSPWDNTLQPISMPPKGVRECVKLRLAIGQSEYESTGFVVTNLGDTPIDSKVSVECPGIVAIVRECFWVKQHNGISVCDALVFRRDGKISIPPMENREVWLTFKTQNTNAGTYRGRVIISSPSKAQKIIPIEIKVYPVTLPEVKPLYTCFWDYVVPVEDGDYRASAFVSDLRNHYVNVAVLPMLINFDVDNNGSLKPTDYKKFDMTIRSYGPMKPRKFLLYWGAEAGNLEAMTTPRFLSPEWKVLFRKWFVDWIEHIKGLGIGYDQFIMYPYDEHINANAAEIAKLIKEVDNNVVIYANAMGQSLEEIEAIKPYVDIWCPYLEDYLNRPPYDRQYDIKAVSKKVFTREPARFWTYANAPGATGPGIAPPYRDYRLAVWKAWQLGMGGFGFWNYTFYRQVQLGSPMYWDPGGPNWQMVYAADAIDAPPGLPKDELVIPSRRWEATREGIEDYCYLYMLQQAINTGNIVGSKADARRLLIDLPKELLRNPEEPQRVDKAKEKLLQILYEVK